MRTSELEALINDAEVMKIIQENVLKELTGLEKTEFEALLNKDN
jgi:hypothetical protein